MKRQTSRWLYAALMVAGIACAKNQMDNLSTPSNDNHHYALFSGGNYPDQVVNLSPWHLYLPQDINGENILAAISIDSATLLANYTSTYFKWDTLASGDTVIRFWCPIDGATTTPGTGSDHPRTELQENQVWYLSPTGVAGRLNATVSVGQFPPDTADIIIGQIHGGSSKTFKAGSYPFVMLHAKHDSVEAYVKGDTVGNSGTSHAILLKGVALGKKITYSIVDSAGHIKITASAPGSTGPGAWDTLVPPIWASSPSIPVHFAAGDYSQELKFTGPSDTLPNSAYGGRLYMYNLTITH